MRKTELGSAFGVMHSVSASASASPRATCVVHLDGYGAEAERATRMLGHPISIVNQYQLRKLVEERDTLRAALADVVAANVVALREGGGFLTQSYVRRVADAHTAAAAALADEDGSTAPEASAE